MSASEVSAAERRDWLRLARTETVGPVTFTQLLRRFGSPARALDALPELARRGGRMTPPRIPSPAEAEREIEAGERLGARLLIGAEPAFPPMLAALDPPPPVIWVMGDPALLQRRAIAVVGARIASAAGQRFARDLARAAGAEGLVVVSGMARGVDGAAHEGALETGTVAVLGGGIDDIYPPEHAGLYQRLAERGAIVSESAPGQRAQAKDFPRRNRLISGLSLAVVVVEAELRSGSLITARLAAEQGRDVLAVPGSPLDPRAKGTNDLIRQGAALCEGIEDVLRAIEHAPRLREPGPSPYDPAGFEEPDAALVERIAALLSPTPTPRDELVRSTGAPAPRVYAALMELALAGRAELLAGGLVASGDLS
ncbi:DNA-processing protein DprA [Phenylobacterium montanum]|uniref:DNA-processing protein DprA n=1 Tax=Phenylobacterium montanum TaxID=2823693 RepID=A0A975G083_9CAUL|nr:DNA-processing protein DprA [Caulobacter sp. S6]QUD88194.1 DNA-processing protein DprA [Caulobacter sp. S6]